MRLIELSADHSSFRTVRFNSEGISLIVGGRSRKDERDKDKTYNGVGKSLVVALIHFCLGSNKIKALEEAIPNWEFRLRFEMGGSTHIISRSTSTQNLMVFDGRKIKLKEFREEVESELFNIPDGIERLSFRALLYKFLRRDKRDYVDAECTNADRSPYEGLVRNVFLLGLDVESVAEKARLNQRLKHIKASEKSLKNDPLLREFYTANRDADIELSFLEERVTELEKNRQNFTVAEDYYEVEKQANNLALRLQTLRNRAVILHNAIDNISNSLKVRPDISPGDILIAYKEVSAAFREETLHRLDEVKDFHEQLTRNRVVRLNQECRRLEGELNEKEQSIRELNTELNEKTIFLGRSRALDYFVAINQEISNLNAKAQKLRDYSELGRRWSDELATIKTAMQQEVLRANEYLSQIHPQLEEINSVFKAFSRRLYPDSPAGLSLKNNDGDNQIRFNFEVRIENDASDGINEARVFCYDLTLLTAGYNHHMKFTFHDSRLYSDIDPRQRAEIFRIADQSTRNSGRQYIATLNEDQIDGMRPYLSEQEYQNVIEDNKILELGDRRAEEKLLGIQVDMHY
jgi:uncharacterized protein YydD (DUF2326 family)